MFSVLQKAETTNKQKHLDAENNHFETHKPAGESTF